MASGREAAKRTLQQVRPVLSVNKEEAKRRVLNLYKAWYRSIPIIGQLKVIFSYQILKRISRNFLKKNRQIHCFH